MICHTPEKGARAGPLYAGPFYSLPSQFLSGSRAAVGVAFINTVGAVGGFVGPLLLGLSTQQWTTLVIFGIFDILAALLLLGKACCQ